MADRAAGALVLALVIALTGCGGPDAASDTAATSIAPTTTTAVETAPTRPPITVPIVTTPARTGEVPAELLGRILDDATERTGSTDPEVLRDEAVTWSDGSLGCPEPGMVYRQVLVAGYWVVIRAGGITLDYRAGESGAFRLCESPTKLPPAPVDPDV